MKKRIDAVITDDENGLMIKAVLSHRLGLSRREISRLKFTRGLFLNGQECRVTEVVHAGDQMELIFPEKDAGHAMRIAGKPDILYEDEDLVIVNKPAGMVCHPSHEHLHDDMGSLLQSYYESGFTIRAVGRLDKDVSGLMCYAKNQPAAARLSSERKQDLLHKTYLAIAEGRFERSSDRLYYALKKVKGHRERVVDPSGRQCITDYEVLRQKKDYALVKVTIVTGRTHQIRAGMAWAGHPLCGDRLYGGHEDRIERPALHCHDLILKQPFTGKNIHVQADLPDDMQRLMDEE